MRKLVIILLAFIAAVTFIRAYDNPNSQGPEFSETAIIIEKGH
jgi:hypothetical protein